MNHFHKTVQIFNLHQVVSCNQKLISFTNITNQTILQWQKSKKLRFY